MNFDLGPDDRALADGIREVCGRHFALDDLRANGMGPKRWEALVNAGVFDLRVPESQGGLGMGMTHAAVVFEQLGRALVPGPIVETHIGRARGATEPTIGIIERTAATIDHLDQLAVVSVMDDEGLWRVAPDDLDVEPVEPSLDPFTPVHRVRSIPKGDHIAKPDVVEAIRREGAVLVAAQQVGIAAACTDAAVAYAKEREQFGRPIGSFQAVKHLCADMYVRTEVARAAVYAAACTVDDPAVGNVDRAVAAAKVLADDAAYRNGKTSIQVHGGMGFTWEVDAHLYVKRAAILRTRFATHDSETMAASL